MNGSTDLRQATKRWRHSANKKILLFALLLTAISLFSLCCGNYPLKLFAKDAAGEMSRKVFFTLRLPRVLAGILAGGVLGVTGAVCQTVFCNPLASPDITGVASGASLGAAVSILLGVSGIARVSLAFLGGISALLLLILFVRLSGSAGAERKGRYLLAGILVGSAADAGLMILKTVADPERELSAIEYWIMGSFSAITAQKLCWMALGSLPALALLFLFSGQALILSRGREEARSVGVSPALWQGVLLFLSTFAVAGVVSFVGVIGFIGLIVPHMALALAERRGKEFTTLCFLIGALLTVISDLLARTCAPGEELPIGIFCVGFAVLWFGFLFCRGKVMGGE